MKNLFLILSVILSVSVQAQVTKSTLDNFLFRDKSYYDIVHEFDSVIDAQNAINSSQAQSNGGGTQTPVSYIDDGLIKNYGRWQSYWKNRVDEEGSFKTGQVNREALLNNEIELCSNQEVISIEWSALGPMESDPINQQNQGRGMAIAVNPINQNIILAGTNGIYRSMDGGVNFEITTDDEGFSNFGVQKLLWHPTVNNIAFAATGINRMNQSENYGIGLIYSTDYGQTWERSQLDFDASSTIGQFERKLVLDIDIDPRSTASRTIAYATIFGFGGVEFYMLDGPINSSWVKIHSSPEIWDRKENIFANLTINQANPNEFWFWANDGVKMGTKDFNNPSAIPILKSYSNPNLQNSCQDTSINRVRISCQADGTPIFQFFQYFDANCNNLEYYKPPTSFLGPWTYLFSNDQRSSPEDFVVSPSNPDIYYTTLFQNSGGQSYVYKIDATTGVHQKLSSNNVHADHRHIDLYETSSSGNQDKLYFATDGGFAYSLNGQDSYPLPGKGLNIVCYYGLDVAEFEPEYVLAGAQDGSINEFRNGEWAETQPGGDNFDCLIDPRGNGIVHQQANNVYYSSTNFGSSNGPNFSPQSGNYTGFAFDLDPNGPDTLIAGWTHLYKSINAGGSWSAITDIVLPLEATGVKQVSSIVICPSNPDVIYYAREGKNINEQINGGIFKLEQQSDGSYFHTDITNNLRRLPKSNYGDDPLYDEYITDIAVDPNDESRIWISLSGYDPADRVYHSENGGASWANTDSDTTLPAFPVNTIVYQNGTDDRLYIGTDIGVFYKDNTTNCWVYYGDDQVGTIVNELDINYCTQTLYAATWGRGLWKAPLLKTELIIDSDEIWDQNKTIHGDILIKSGATLNISGTVNPNGTTTTNIFLPKDGKIIIEEGARLNVDGATLTNQCGEMWDGIDVHGTKDLWHPPIANIINDDYPSSDPLLHIYQQGVVVLNNATLSHAKNAVSLGEFDGSKYVGGGGIVLSYESNFINNRRSFEFLSYPNFSNISTIENSIFEIDDNYRGEDLTEPHHISMWETKDVRVIGCDFDNTNSSFTIDDVYAGTAIYTIDASYIARAICDPQNIEALTGDCILNPDRNKFTNLHRGIYSTATGVLPGSLQINKNEFNNVKKGITLRSTGDAITVRNILSSDEIEMLNEGINQPSYGIYLEGLYNFTCTENSVGNMWSGILTNSAGIGKNRLYRNIVDNTFYYGTTGFGFDLFGFSSGKNLEFKCNQFSNNGWIGDIAVTGKIMDQGTNLRPIVNTFSDALAIDINAQSLSLFDGWIATNNTNGLNTPSFNYFYPDNAGNPELNPEYTFLVNSFGIINPNLTVYSQACQQEELGNILMKMDENANEVVSTQGYYSVLGDLNNSSNPDLWVKDRVLTDLINAHLIKGEYANIETLLQGETSNHWRKLQLAEFQRMQAKYLDAKNNLDALINDNDVIAEVKDVAQIYLIRTNLEQQGGTWFDILPADLTIIQNFALAKGEMPATLIARNILELTKNMHFEVRIDEFANSISGPEDTTVIEEPRFSLYPNPIEGQLNLEYSEEVPEYFDIYIYELLENSEVYRGSMESSLFQLDVSEWQTGFYTILVFDPENNELFKSDTHIKSQ